MNITVVVITKDEEEMLPGCLDSVGWARELLVVDSHSTDRTVAIAEKHGARVVTVDFEGYGKMREAALAHMRTKWVFYLDADERAEEGLEHEVGTLLESGTATAARMPRKNIMLGKWCQYGGWYPDYQTRLFRVKYLRGWKGQLHENPLYDGPTTTLSHGLVHLTSKSIDAMLAKTMRWSQEEARLLHESRHPQMSGWRFFRVMGAVLYDRMVKGQAWRDGTAGVLLALYQMFSAFVTYAKLWELQEKKRIEKAYKVLDE